MARINTSKTLNNRFFNGGPDGMTPFYSSKISVSPSMSKQYDYALTDDPVLLQDRKDTEEKIYNIFIASPFYQKYDISKGVTKIDKKDISDIFYYVKEQLEKVKSISTFEMVIGIMDFFDFPADYLVNKVISPKIKCELIDDYAQNMGMKDKIDKQASKKLF